MRGGGGVELSKHPGKDARDSEHCQGAGELGILSWECGEEPLFSDVFIIRVHRVLAVYILLSEKLRETQMCSR